MPRHNQPVGRTRRLLGRLFLIGFALALAGLAVWAILPSPRREIKRLVQRTERVFASRDIDALRFVLAERFSNIETGDREETIEYLKEIMDQVTEIKVRIRRIRIDVRGNEAFAIVEFNVAGVLKGSEVFPSVPFRGLSGRSDLSNPIERVRLHLVRERDGVFRIDQAELLPPAEVGARTEE